MLAVGNTSYKTSNTSSLPSSVLKGLSSSGQHPSTNPQLSTTLLPPVSSNAVINNNNNIPHSTTHRSQLQQHHHERRRNYRYTGDPASHAADKKAYVNGDPEGTPMHLSGCADPRNPNRNDKAYLELPIPKFKIDRCWVGYLPAKEVTFRNLNDNITKAFLADICNRFGEIDDCRIYYDRVTKKHLGLGTVIFKKTKAARECVKTLHNSTKMGSVISVSLDTGGIDRTKQYATLIRGPEQEKAAAAAAVAAAQSASPPSQSQSFTSDQTKQITKQMPNIPPPVFLSSAPNNISFPPSMQNPPSLPHHLQQQNHVPSILPTGGNNNNIHLNVGTYSTSTYSTHAIQDNYHIPAAAVHQSTTVRYEASTTNSHNKPVMGDSSFLYPNSSTFDPYTSYNSHQTRPLSQLSTHYTSSNHSTSKNNSNSHKRQPQRHL